MENFYIRQIFLRNGFSSWLLCWFTLFCDFSDSILAHDVRESTDTYMMYDPIFTVHTTRTSVTLIFYIYDRQNIQVFSFWLVDYHVVENSCHHIHAVIFSMHSTHTCQLFPLQIYMYLNLPGKIYRCEII